MYRRIRKTAILFALSLSALRPAAGALAQTTEQKADRSSTALHLANLQADLAQALRQAHLAVTMRTEDELIADYHIHDVKLHLRSKTGQESPALTKLPAPFPDGIRLQLQFVTGATVTQAVRPQSLRQRYRTPSGKRVEWATYLDQFFLSGSNVTLLLDLDYGTKVSQARTAKLINAIRTYATSHGATEGQTIKPTASGI